MPKNAENAKREDCEGTKSLLKTRIRGSRANPSAMDRLPLLEQATAEFLASEYLAYKRWSRRRGQRYVCPLADYHASIIVRLGITLASVDEQVRRLETRWA